MPMVQRVDVPLSATEAHPKVAAVAPADSAYGVLGVYEAYRELQESPVRYRIFRTIEEARTWLQLPDSPAREP